MYKIFSNINLQIKMYLHNIESKFGCDRYSIPKFMLFIILKQSNHKYIILKNKKIIKYIQLSYSRLVF